MAQEDALQNNAEAVAAIIQEADSLAQSKAIGFLHQHVRGRKPRFRGFIRRVDRKAAGLSGLEDAELNARLSDCRARLYSEGFGDDLAAESFALVREMTERQLVVA